MFVFGYFLSKTVWRLYVCMWSLAIYFWEHLELWNLEHGTLGTFKKSTFFRFSKISNLTPPGQFLTFFWPTFLKAVAFFFGWSKSLALLDSEPHGGSLEPPFWIFQKYAFLHPWRTPDGFRFFKNRRKLTFLLTFLKTVPFIFGWSKSLTFLDLEAHGGPLGTPFWIFQKYAFLRPWLTSDGFSFFSKSSKFALRIIALSRCMPSYMYAGTTNHVCSRYITGCL